MKKFLSIAALAAVTAVSAESSKFQGIHGGVHAGYMFTQSNIREMLRDGRHPTLHASASSGPAAGLHLGYVHNIWRKLHLGVELDYTYHNAKDTIASRHTITMSTVNSYTVRTQSDWGGSLVTGWAIDNYMPYVKLGYGGTKFKIEYRRNPNPAATTGHSSNKSSTLNAFRFGVGVQGAVMDCLLVGLEFNHRFIRSNIVHDADTVGTPAASPARIVRVNPKSVSSIMAKVTYRFGM